MRQTVVVLLTEGALETRVGIPEVEGETVLEDTPAFQAEDGAALEEVVTRTEVRVTKEAMEAEVSLSRMGHGTRWVAGTTTVTILIHNRLHRLHLLGLPPHSLMHHSL